MLTAGCASVHNNKTAAPAKAGYIRNSLPPNGGCIIFVHYLMVCTLDMVHYLMANLNMVHYLMVVTLETGHHIMATLDMMTTDDDCC